MGSAAGLPHRQRWPPGSSAPPVPNLPPARPGSVARRKGKACPGFSLIYAPLLLSLPAISPPLPSLSQPCPMSQGPSCTGQGRGEVNPPGCGFVVVGVSPATSTEAEDFCRSQAERQGSGWRCRPHAAEPGPQGTRAGVPSPGSPQRCCLLCTPPQPLPSEGRQGWAVLGPRLRFVFSVLADAGDSSHGFAALDSRSAQSPQVSMASMSLGCQSFAAEALRDLVPGAGDRPRDT